MEIVGQPNNRKGLPNYPAEFKQRLAKAACEPGVSVSKLALQHGINANMLFKWRRDLRAGLLNGVGIAGSAFAARGGAARASSPNTPERHFIDKLY